MAQKYVSLPDAAKILGISEDEVNALRESGELRGFADRGTWKFRREAIDELERSRGAGSDPDIPILDGSAIISGSGISGSGISGSGIVGRDDLKRTEDLTRPRGSDEPTEPLPKVDAAPPPESDTTFDVSDSEMDMLDRYSEAGAPATPSPLLADPNSEMAGEFEEDSAIIADAGPESDATFDVSDSEMDMLDRYSEAGAPATPSPLLADPNSEMAGEFDEDSAILAAGDSGTLAMEQDEPVSLDGPESRADDDDVTLDLGPDSGVAVGVGDSGIALDLAGEASGVDTGESGIALDLGMPSGVGVDLDAADSGIALDVDGSGVDESGLALDAGDSGIALDMGGSGIDDSGLALEAGDSGLALDAGESGLALDFALESAIDGDDEGTERLTLDGEASDVLEAGDSAVDTSLPDDSEFDLDSADSSPDHDAYEEEGFDDSGEFDAADELDEVDDFDEDEFDDDEAVASDDDPFEDDRTLGAFKGKKKREQGWGAVTAVGLILCACAMSVTLLVTWQSMRVMWTGTATESPIDPVVDAVTGMIN